MFLNETDCRPSRRDHDTHVDVEEAVEDEEHDALEAVADGEEVGEDVDQDLRVTRVHSQESQNPGQAQQGQQHCRGFQAHPGGWKLTNALKYLNE